MLKDNLIMLRNVYGFSQEELAEKIGISRQAYAKWETGATIPDIEKCMKLAEIYNTTIDSLIKTTTVDGGETLPPPPKGKQFFSIFNASLIRAYNNCISLLVLNQRHCLNQQMLPFPTCNTPYQSNNRQIFGQIVVRNSTHDSFLRNCVWRKLVNINTSWN